MASLWCSFDCGWIRLATLTSNSFDLCTGVAMLVFRLIYAKLHPLHGGLDMSHDLRVALASALATHEPASLSSHSSSPHEDDTLVVENSDLGTGQHATAFRVHLSSSNGLVPGQFQSKRAAILKFWRPASIREAITWGMAALELRLAKIFRLHIRPNTYDSSKHCSKECQYYLVDYKAALSRRAQYLASFEVEASLYRATRGLGSASGRLGIKAGAPNALWLASGVIQGAGWSNLPWVTKTWLLRWWSRLTDFSNLTSLPKNIDANQSGAILQQRGSSGALLQCNGFASIMLLEDVCSKSSIKGLDRREDGDLDSTNHYNNDRGQGSWHAAKGFGLAEARVCLTQAAKLHATFWGIGNTRGRDTNGPCSSCRGNYPRSYTSTSTGSSRTDGVSSRMTLDREEAVADARRRLGMHEFDELWAEGGYWVGEKRPLPGDDIIRSNNSNNNKSKATALAVQDAWAATVKLHSSRWNSAFLNWAANIQPDQVFARALEYKFSGSSDNHRCQHCCNNRYGTSSSNTYPRTKQRTASSDPEGTHDASTTTPLEAELALLRPLTIVHGDYKVNNIYLQEVSADDCSHATEYHEAGSVETAEAFLSAKLRSAAPEEASKRRRAHVIDWQWCGVGVGALDVAHFLCTSLHFEEVLAQPGAVGLLVATYRDDLALYVAEERYARQVSPRCKEESDEGSIHSSSDRSRAAFDAPRKEFNAEADDLFDDDSKSWPSVPSLQEIQRQVALHMVRYTLDALLYKWPNAPPSEMDANNGQCAKHGLDRRSYDHMQACIALGVNAARWLSGDSPCTVCEASHQNSHNGAECETAHCSSCPWREGHPLF